MPVIGIAGLEGCSQWNFMPRSEMRRWLTGLAMITPSLSMPWMWNDCFPRSIASRSSDMLSSFVQPRWWQKGGRRPSHNTILLSWLRCGTDRPSRKAGGLLLASIIRSRSFETEFVHAESSRPISAPCGLYGRCRRDLGRFARRALPRRIQGARSGKKLSTYECGFNAFDDARMRFDVRFYLVSLLFIIFDLEVAFLFPWAVAFREVGAFGF